MLQDKAKMKMNGYVDSIAMAARKNENFRQVLFTSTNLQLILMTLNPKEEIGSDMHESVDQFFHIEVGEAKFIFNRKEEHLANAGEIVIVYIDIATPPI